MNYFGFTIISGDLIILSSVIQYKENKNTFNKIFFFNHGLKVGFS